ncbi:hypothetical protein [Burkholderia sp. Bp8963]|uniref:hypothetical protein n=1 Tax=Burkholderia sp. Bp8963 TaxID=2184547 RepID=UPI000F5A00A9|nr:hypothetical protein [Burkholderia sp. Bp8963]
MENLLFKPKALESQFGIGGSTRSLLAASEQDFGGPKQNLRASLRFGPIFIPIFVFRGWIAAAPCGPGRGDACDAESRRKSGKPVGEPMFTC